MIKKADITGIAFCMETVIKIMPEYDNLFKKDIVIIERGVSWKTGGLFNQIHPLNHAVSK
jgi:hypothetical protein